MSIFIIVERQLNNGPLYDFILYPLDQRIQTLLTEATNSSKVIGG